MKIISAILAVIAVAVLYIAVQVHAERVHRQKAEAYAACMSLYELHNAYVNRGQAVPDSLNADLKKCEAR